jgi:type I restriction enzyme S subunit
MSIENNSTIEQGRNTPKGDAQSLPKGWVETTLGGLPIEWKLINAESFCVKVADGTHDSPKKSREGKLLVTSKNIKNSKLDMSSAYKIAIQDFIEINKRSKVDQWDVLLSMIGTVGEVCLLDKTPDFAIKNVGLFKCKNEVKSRWLFYFLKSKMGKNYILSRLSGTTQKYITLGELRKFPIPSPLIEEQKAIAQILTAFDDKIELLQTQNKTLETTAQTIFKEWFGKYQIGDELPEGWRVGKLGEEFNITIGRTPPRKEKEWFSNTPIGKKWISIKDIGNSGAYISNTAEYLTNKAIERFNIPIIPKNTTILSFKMTVGKLTITTEDMLSNEAIAHLKLKQNTVLSSEFIYLYLQDLDFNALGSTSSIVTAINSTMIKYLEFLMPEKNILLQFDELIKPIFDKIYNNTTQIQTLKQTRDTLLPKLMSGQLRVDKFKERAV